ncbi:aldo/keto reductase [Kushneria indalinina]|uniref:Putative oxidoreductase n=1 Tax=Kushneria indalinina DSM 14324 TaxID=1122140 RepID=A0A3D9DU73_9GAMM|nr:aldo/keto reductase [Kushneria indalinina]REC94195.1 putative oxidoreductase [Kushneria indalinina DSM 14324]
MSMTASPFVIGLRQLPYYDSLQTPEALASWFQQRLAEGLCEFDHSDLEKGQETLLGQAIDQLPNDRVRQLQFDMRVGVVPAQHNDDRFGAKYYDTRPEYLDAVVDRALSQLGLTQLNTLMLMRPDPLMDVEATGRTLDAIIDSGRARRIGVANFLPAQWRHLQGAMQTPLACQQMEMSIARSQMLFDGMWDSLLQDNMAGLAGSPLWGGRIFENQLGQVLKAMADTHQVSPAGIALAWLNTIPGQPRAVVGTLRSERLQSLAHDAGLTLSRPEWFALLEAVRACRVP